MEVRNVPTFLNREISSYGCIDGGYKLMRLAWPRMKHQFSIRRDKEQVDGDLGRSPQK
jgi:hypothetical protein